MSESLYFQLQTLKKLGISILNTIKHLSVKQLNKIQMDTVAAEIKQLLLISVDQLENDLKQRKFANYKS